MGEGGGVNFTDTFDLGFIPKETTMCSLRVFFFFFLLLLFGNRICGEKVMLAIAFF